MADFKPKPGAALPFLEAENRRAEQRRQNASPLTLLEILARQAGRDLPLFDLQAQSGMEPSRYEEALLSLRNAGYIEFAGEGFEGVIRLTDSGSQVVKLAKPA